MLARLVALAADERQAAEDAACNRIAVAAACRRFPVILGLLASGSMTLTSVRRLGSHLTPENCEAVLARALNRSRPEIDALVAEVDPQPDVISTVRKVAVGSVTVSSPPGHRSRARRHGAEERHHRLDSA